MELNTFERLMILNNLPAEGSLTTIRIVRELREALSFSEAEHKALKFSQDEGMVHWDPAGDHAKDIPMGDKAREIVRKQLAQLNTEEKLTEAHLSVCEKFGIVE